MSGGGCLSRDDLSIGCSAWHDLTFLFLSLSLSGIDDTAEIFVQTRVLVPRDRLPSGGEENGVPEGQMFCVESGKQIRARRQHERWRTREYWFLALEDARECETRRDFMRRGRNGEDLLQRRSRISMRLKPLKL